MGKNDERETQKEMHCSLEYNLTFQRLVTKRFPRAHRAERLCLKTLSVTGMVIFAKDDLGLRRPVAAFAEAPCRSTLRYKTQLNSRQVGGKKRR
jgi:hypothetical protein